jgi:predicted PolB exonuclease-like 3'-5' exonuclease
VPYHKKSKIIYVMKKLYVDIETAPEYETFEQMPEQGQRAFIYKMKRESIVQEFLKTVEQWNGGNPDAEAESQLQAIYAQLYKDKAALFAEFAKIICLGVGYVLKEQDGGSEYIGMKAFVGDEEFILREFCASISKSSPEIIVAHNGKAFDFPWLCRRLLINSMRLPEILVTEGKSKWQLPWSDTMEFWQFHNFKDYVSLQTLAYVFGIPSPKESMDGAMVPVAFYQGKIKAIANYCLDDVRTLINVDRRCNVQQVIEVEKRYIIGIPE